ncbi:MAG TPA: hypothetical protein P5538_08585, partial [Bacteroidales bacterium]|nr:hypothetical protein [Bacteroidales bacterium]
WVKPPLVEGATYSHYVVRVPDRQKAMLTMAKKGVQLGQLIEYSIPHMDAYKTFYFDLHYTKSLQCSNNTVNLPVWGGKILASKM